MRVFLGILGILFLLFVLICLSSVVVQLGCRDGAFTWSVRYCGIRLLPRKSGGKPKQKQKKPDGDSKDKGVQRRKFLMDRLWLMMQNIAGKCDLAGSGIAALPGPLQWFLRAVTWSDIVTDFVIGGEDAAKAAQQYGMVQAGLQTILDASRHLIHVRRKDVRVGVDFTADRSKWDFSCKIKVRIGTLMAAGIWLLWRFLKDSRQAKQTLVSDVI